MLHFVGHAAFILPGTLLVEVGHLGGAVAALHEVAGAFHEEDASDHHADADSSEQVHENGEQEDDDEHHRIGAGDAEQVLKALEVNDSPTDGDQDAGQDGQRDVAHEAAQTEQHGEQHQRVDHAADLRAATALHVHDGAHGRAGAADAAEEAADHIADTLPHQLAVAVVVGFGDVVGHHGGEQRVDTAQAGERKSGDDRGFQHGAPVEAGQAQALFRKDRHREAGGNLADEQLLVHVEEQRDDGHHQQCH